MKAKEEEEEEMRVQLRELGACCEMGDGTAAAAAAAAAAADDDDDDDDDDDANDAGSDCSCCGMLPKACLGPRVARKAGEAFLGSFSGLPR
jgi:hypothetical protein